jgi:hypothetical protein
MLRPLALAVLSAALPTLRLAAQEGQGEFSAHGQNVVRIESEAKLRVPLERTDEVWQWLQERYRDPSWLDSGETKHSATFGDELFEDVYYDTPTFDLYGQQSGVRHRSRNVLEGSAMRKDGRQLMQLKLSRGDSAGLDRSEIKFEVVHNPRPKTAEDVHAMLGMIAPEMRDSCKQRLREFGVDALALRPVLQVDQNRRRVYLADLKGALATLTLDLCTSSSWGASLRWTEMELELNEIRYTEADESARQSMQALAKRLQADLQAKFPDIVQDQTPKYNKALDMIVADSALPVRWLITNGITREDFLTRIALCLVAVVGGGAFAFARLRRRRATAAAT